MVITSIQYLARDKLYNLEKPYAADFLVDEESAVRSNYLIKSVPTTVTPIQPSDNFDLDTNGFCRIKTQLHTQVEDILSRSQNVEFAYFEEIETMLKEHFPEYTRFEGIEFVV